MPFLEFRYFSEELQKQTAANVILPEPTVKGPHRGMLLLHGLSDDHTIWARRTSLERYVSQMPLVVVMANGDRSFYCDAVEGFPYGRAIGEELPKRIEHYFRVEGLWCVAGLSMGGYGALRLALTYPERFVAVSSHSGALEFGRSRRPDDPISKEWERILGEQPEGGPNDLFALAERTKPIPRIRIDCGVDDFLIESNRSYHAHLKDLKVDHVYEEFPGGHDWAYWDRHIQDTLRFFHKALGLPQQER